MQNLCCRLAAGSLWPSEFKKPSKLKILLAKELNSSKKKTLTEWLSLIGHSKLSNAGQARAGLLLAHLQDADHTTVGWDE